MESSSICKELKNGVGQILDIWRDLAHAQPWFSEVEEEGINGLPELIAGLTEAALCRPGDLDAHRRKVAAAIEHGYHRRSQGRSEHFILAEYHLLRQAIWRYLVNRHGLAEPASAAIMLIDTAITLATNASLWGFHRDEAQEVGLWDGIHDRLAMASPLLHRASSGDLASYDSTPL